MIKLKKLLTPKLNLLNEHEFNSIIWQINNPDVKILVEELMSSVLEQTGDDTPADFNISEEDQNKVVNDIKNEIDNTHMIPGDTEFLKWWKEMGIGLLSVIFIIMFRKSIVNKIKELFKKLLNKNKTSAAEAEPVSPPASGSKIFNFAGKVAATVLTKRIRIMFWEKYRRNAIRKMLQTPLKTVRDRYAAEALEQQTAVDALKASGTTGRTLTQAEELLASLNTRHDAVSRMYNSVASVFKDGSATLRAIETKFTILGTKEAYNGLAFLRNQYTSLETIAKQTEYINQTVTAIETLIEGGGGTSNASNFFSRAWGENTLLSILDKTATSAEALPEIEKKIYNNIMDRVTWPKETTVVTGFR